MRVYLFPWPLKIFIWIWSGVTHSTFHNHLIELPISIIKWFSELMWWGLYSTMHDPWLSLFCSSCLIHSTLHPNSTIANMKGKGWSILFSPVLRGVKTSIESILFSSNSDGIFLKIQGLSLSPRWSLYMKSHSFSPTCRHPNLNTFSPISTFSARPCLVEIKIFA